jgi:hypothetical protein
MRRLMSGIHSSNVDYRTYKNKTKHDADFCINRVNCFQSFIKLSFLALIVQ